MHEEVGTFCTRKWFTSALNAERPPEDDDYLDFNEDDCDGDDDNSINDHRTAIKLFDF